MRSLLLESKNSRFVVGRWTKGVMTRCEWDPLLIVGGRTPMTRCLDDDGFSGKMLSLTRQKVLIDDVTIVYTTGSCKKAKIRARYNECCTAGILSPLTVAN